MLGAFPEIILAWFLSAPSVRLGIHLKRLVSPDQDSVSPVPAELFKTDTFLELVAAHPRARLAN